MSCSHLWCWLRKALCWKGQNMVLGFGNRDSMVIVEMPSFPCHIEEVLSLKLLSHLPVALWEPVNLCHLSEIEVSELLHLQCQKPPPRNLCWKGQANEVAKSMSIGQCNLEDSQTQMAVDWWPKSSSQVTNVSQEIQCKVDTVITVYIWFSVAHPTYSSSIHTITGWQPVEGSMVHSAHGWLLQEQQVMDATQIKHATSNSMSHYNQIYNVHHVHESLSSIRDQAASWTTLPICHQPTHENHITIAG